jgi:hypothetical protein
MPSSSFKIVKDLGLAIVLTAAACGGSGNKQPPKGPVSPEPTGTIQPGGKSVMPDLQSTEPTRGAQPAPAAAKPGDPCSGGEKR